VPAGGGDLEHALGSLLPFDVAQIGQRGRVAIDDGLGPREQLVAFEVVDEREQVRRGLF
jgi:hypothetical protein